MYCFRQKVSKMFSPRYYGTTFNVYYGATEQQVAASERYHLIISRDHFDIITPDWKTVYLKIEVHEVEEITIRKTLITLPLKNQEKGAAVYLDTRPDNPDKLKEALTILGSIPTPETKYLALQSILPTFSFADNLISMNLHNSIIDQCKHLLAAFHAPQKTQNLVPGSFVDIFTCAYRLRYDNGAAQNIEKTTQEFTLDICRYLLKEWCLQINNAANTSTKTKSPIYYSRLIPNMVETISIAANTLCISWDDLLAATRQFAENGDISGIGPAAERVSNAVKDGMSQGFLEVPPQDKTNLMTLMNIVIIALSGLAVGMYNQDLDNLAAKTVDFTRAVFMHDPSEEVKTKLDQQRQAYLTELLRFLDGERFDPNFQFVYCTWNLRNDEDLMNIQ